MNPEIILFDEVTAALDPEMVREVLDVIFRSCQRWHDDAHCYPRNELRPPSSQSHRVYG